MLVEEKEEYWPQSWNVKETDEELEMQVTKKVTMPIVKKERSSPFNIDIQKYNSYDRLIRVTAIIIRFLKCIAKRKLVFMTEEDEYTQAKFLWIKSEQRNEFQDIFANLEKMEKKLLKQVRELQLFIDEKQIIRCKGRFDNAIISTEEKYPIFLPKPKQSRFVFLLVTSIHKKLMHAGVGTTLSNIRKNFFFTCGRQQTYHVISKCHACTRDMAKSFKQPSLSQLPSFRLNAPESPFAYVGIDLCGPFKVLEEKKYILLMTCLVTRAIVLEVMDNLETAQIYAGMRRIASRTEEFTKDS